MSNTTPLNIGFIGVSSSAATIDDLTKAYRKTSRTLHPDKFKPSLPQTPPGSPPRKLTRSAIALQKKNAEERYSRLRLVYNILKGSERERYDHFLKNGFPRWRGTGYYYARFRPGLGSVLLGLFLFVGGFGHYAYLWLNTRQQRKFFENFINEARVSAWGQAGVPGIVDIKEKVPTPSPSATNTENEGPRNRKERRFQKKAASSSSKKGTNTGDNSDTDSTPAQPQKLGSAGVGRRKVISGNGKVLIVNSTGEVFLVEENEDGEEVELKLDINEIETPGFRNTAVYRLPAWIFGLTIGRFLGKKKAELEEGGFDEGEVEGEDVEEEGEDGKVKKRKNAAKASGGLPVKVEKKNGLPRRKTSGRK